MKRRYITQATADDFRRDAVEMIPTGARSFDVQTLAWTEWYIVPDEDPRVDTVEDVSDDT